MIRASIVILVFAFCGSTSAQIESKPSSKLEQRFPDALLRGIVAIGYEDSLGAWHPLATGFIVYNYGEPRPLLVTNRHVFQGRSRNLSNSRRRISIKINMNEEKLAIPILDSWTTVQMELLHKDTVLWTGHPDDSVDVAVTYITRDTKQSWFALNNADLSAFPGSLFDTTASLSLAQSIIFLGFPVGLGTEENPVPLVRSGIVSQIDSDRRRFRVDAQVFRGSSGSPVFSTFNHLGDEPDSLRAGLVGIVSSFRSTKRDVNALDEESKIEIESEEFAYENVGIARVFSAKLILETIDAHLKRFSIVR